MPINLRRVCTAAAVSVAAIVATVLVAAALSMPTHESASPTTAPSATATPTATTTAAPDWTVAPCKWWAESATPELPAYTYTDRCAADDGTIVYAENGPQFLPCAAWEDGAPQVDPGVVPDHCYVGEGATPDQYMTVRDWTERRDAGRAAQATAVEREQRIAACVDMRTSTHSPSYGQPEATWDAWSAAERDAWVQQWQRGAEAICEAAEARR